MFDLETLRVGMVVMAVALAAKVAWRVGNGR